MADISYLVADARDENNQLVARIDKLYEELIRPIGGKYANQSLIDKNRVLCPFHEDQQPSLGIINSRSSGVQLFNCFGCGKKGNVVHFYIFYQRQYENRDLSTEEATRELAVRFNIFLPEDIEKEVVKNVEEKKAAILDNKQDYTIRDYERDCAVLSDMLEKDKALFKATAEHLQLHWLETKGGVV